jgi:hypothetical protein
LRNFQPQHALLAVSGALAYAGLGFVVFQRGLRGYTSGSRFG